MAFTPFVQFVASKVTSAMLNTRIGALITELQTAVGRLDITTDWTDLTLAAGCVVYQYKPQIRVIGGQTQLRGGIGKGSNTWGASGGPFALATGTFPGTLNTGPANAAWNNLLRLPAGSDSLSGCLVNPRPGSLQLYTTGTTIGAVVLDGVCWPN